jgi:hypothetical protein
MKISDVAARCPDFRLRFKPRPGWGWRAPRGEAEIRFELIEQLGPFSLLASAAFRWQEEYRGLCGEVVDQRHILHGHRFVLWSMCGADPDIEKTADSRWDFYFSRGELRGDHLDFVDPDSAGVGYGSPLLDEKKA